MRKAIAIIIPLLVIVAVALLISISHADFVSSNPDRFYKQSITEDGNILYLDLKSVRHYKDNLTEYIGIVELSRSSDLFKEACKVIPSTQEPLYVATNMRMDCVNAKFQAGKIIIIGFEKADSTAQLKTIWKEDAEAYSDWIPLKGGKIEPGAKALLCGPSF